MGLEVTLFLGRVKNPGLYLLPSGSTILDIIEASGGMIEGHHLKLTNLEEHLLVFYLQL